ncbi:MAG: hypothetical protein NC206_04480 [Bacteroides sp.]|nr:hypothetical protein [Roseburia sp.]MCM1346320.1 hypothetical protein [Bacteroides sp.]MCM1420791.1 hypothetical protein [Bacteroides sp.]
MNKIPLILRHEICNDNVQLMILPGHFFVKADLVAVDYMANPSIKELTVELWFVDSRYVQSDKEGRMRLYLKPEIYLSSSEWNRVCSKEWIKELQICILREISESICNYVHEIDSTPYMGFRPLPARVGKRNGAIYRMFM